jgi:hypothetical protein
MTALIALIRSRFDELDAAAARPHRDAAGAGRIGRPGPHRPLGAAGATPSLTGRSRAGVAPVAASL